MTVIVKFTRPSTLVPWYKDSSPEATAQYDAFVTERTQQPGFVSFVQVEKTEDGLSETFAVKWSTAEHRKAYKPQYFADRTAYNLQHGIVFENVFFNDEKVDMIEKAVAAQTAATAAK